MLKKIKLYAYLYLSMFINCAIVLPLTLLGQVIYYTLQIYCGILYKIEELTIWLENQYLAQGDFTSNYIPYDKDNTDAKTGNE